jgi:hypothetical protein
MPTDGPAWGLGDASSSAWAGSAAIRCEEDASSSDRDVSSRGSVLAATKPGRAGACSLGRGRRP